MARRPDVVPEGTAGAFRIRGRVLDGAGEPVPDALVETWQADPTAASTTRRPARRGGGFRGFARAPTDDDGTCAILTVKPGPVPGAGGATQAPHIDVSVFARGLLNRVVTRIYFADEADANAADPVLAGAARATAAPRCSPSRGDDGYRFDIHLQGEGETVFFAV